MSIPESLNTPSRRPRHIPKAVLAWSVPVLLGVSAFLGLIALSFIPLSPSATAIDLGGRLNEQRAQPQTAAETQALDRAAEMLEAAQRAIVAEGAKTWHLRSYDRSRTLLWKAESLFAVATDVSASGSGQVAGHLSSP